MFNIGGGEVLVILLVALIVLGPQRLPEAARKVGTVLGEVRRMATGFQSEIKTAFEDAEIAAKGEDRASGRPASSPGPNKKKTSEPPMRRLPPSTAAPDSEGPPQEAEIEGSSTAVPDPASPPPPSPDAPLDDGQSDAVA